MSKAKKISVSDMNATLIKNHIGNIKTSVAVLQSLGCSLTSLSDLDTFGKAKKLTVRDQDENDCQEVMQSWGKLSDKEKVLAYIRFTYSDLLFISDYSPVKGDGFAVKHTIFWLGMIYDGNACLSDFDLDYSYTPKDQIKAYQDFVETQNSNYIKTKFLEGCAALNINTDPNSAEHKSYHKDVQAFFAKYINPKPKTKKTGKK